MKLPLSPPAADHLEFDEICSEVEDFEPLPTLTSDPLEAAEESEETSLDGRILAGLVSP